MHTAPPRRLGDPTALACCLAAIANRVLHAPSAQAQARFVQTPDQNPKASITELVHWQNQGYGLITPVVTEKRLSIEDIR